jgi:uncharacterized protein DUF29
MDAATLYRDDIVTWAEQQAAALRELAVRPGLSNAVDWANLIEEVECLGRSEWKGVAAQIRNALAHVLKGYCDPDSLSRLKWAVETGNSLREARDDFRSSMRPAQHRHGRDLEEGFRLCHRRVDALRSGHPAAHSGAIPVYAR